MGHTNICSFLCVGWVIPKSPLCSMFFFVICDCLKRPHQGIPLLYIQVTSFYLKYQYSVGKPKEAKDTMYQTNIQTHQSN